MFLVLLLAVGAAAQVTRLFDGSLVRECLRDDPAADATVDANCTSERVMLKLLFRATPTSGAGQIARIVMNSPEFMQVFNNRSSGGDPTLPQIEGFSETSIIVEMSELRVRYPTEFWLSVPEDYAVWTADLQVGFAARACESAGERAVAPADCQDESGNARLSDGRSAAGVIIPQSSLQDGFNECFELRCGACLTDTFRGADDRNGLNRERFWWAGSFYRVYRVRNPMIEYTIRVTIINPDGEQEEITLGIQEGYGFADDNSTQPFPHSDTDAGNVDAVTGADFPPVEGSDVGVGRVFATVGYSSGLRIRARLVSQSLFGVVPPAPGLLFARDSTEAALRGYHETRDNPRELSLDNCAVFKSTNGSDSGVAVCRVPQNWFYGVNFEDELRVGRNCCSCLGITQQTWFGSAAHRARSCWDTHATCIPGHDYWSKDRSRTPVFFQQRMQTFRKRQFCLLCTGVPSCGLCDGVSRCRLDDQLAAGLPDIPVGDFSAGPGGGPVQCDWHSSDAAEQQRRLDEVLLQAPPNLPPMFTNTGLSNMWMYRGQLFYDPPDNLGMSVILVVDAEAAFSRLIVRVPTVRLEGVEFGEDCTVVVGSDGELRFRLINESPFSGDFTVTIECADPAYTIVGTNSIGTSVGPAPAERELSFLIAVNRPQNVPSESGGSCTLRLFDAQFNEIPDQTLTTQCREEDQAFTGATGDAALNECIGNEVCDWSNFLKLLLIFLGIALALLILMIAIRKCVRRA